MSEQIKQLTDQIRADWEALKKVNDELQADAKKSGAESQELKNQVNTLNTKLDDNLKRLNDFETKLNRSAAVGLHGQNMANEASEEQKAFGAFLRKGAEKLGPDQVKSLASDSDQDGGYLVVPQMRDRIIERIHLFSPVRELATVETISVGSVLQIPSEGSTNFGAGWVGERGSRTETTSGTFKKEEIPTFEMYAAPRATQSMLDDSAFNVEAWIEKKLAQRFAVVEGTAFISGSGAGQPEGLLTVSGLTEKNSGHATQIQADGLIDLVHALPEFYARNAYFLMRRATLGEIRKLKDGNGQYLWQLGIADKVPNTILGYPYREAPDVPAIAANAYPVLFGDIAMAYTIVDRQGITVLRDPYSNKPFIEFYTTRRVGGQVTLTEAVVKLKISV